MKWQLGPPDNQEGREDKEAARLRRLAALHILAEQAMAVHSSSAARGEVTRAGLRSIRRLWSARARRRRRRRRAAGRAVAIFLAIALLAAIPLLIVHTGASGTYRPVAMKLSAVRPVNFLTNPLYFDLDVPWTRVEIDNQRIQPPQPGANAPVELRAGRHVISWEAEPFPEQSCVLSVPALSDDTCLEAFGGVVRIRGEPAAQIMRLMEETTELPDNQLSALDVAVQSSLDSIAKSTVVQLDDQLPASLANIGLNDGTYTATTTMQLDTSGERSFCQLDLVTGAQNCGLMSNQCSPICSLDYSERYSLGSALPGNEWVTMAAVLMQRNYRSSAGHPPVLYQDLYLGPVGFYDAALLVGLRWRNGLWQAQPLIGKSLIAPVVRENQHYVLLDPGCAEAEAHFIADSTQLERQQYTTIRFVSGSNVATGCLIETLQTIQPSGGKAKKYLAEYMDRLGVLLAVNAVAQKNHPNLLAADSYAQQLAASLATSNVAAIPRLR